MEKNKLIKVAGEHNLPDILLELINFDNSVANDDWFSEEFEFITDEEIYMLKTYSEDDEFLSSFIPFAQANAGGSLYAFWIKNNDISLDKSPIVAFGDEGGHHIVSENIYDLLKILTYDVRPMIDWDSIYYYKDKEDYEPSKYRDQFRNWLNDKYQIESTNNADEIVQTAQEKHQEDFKEWIGKYYSE